MLFAEGFDGASFPAAVRNSHLDTKDSNSPTLSTFDLPLLLLLLQSPLRQGEMKLSGLAYQNLTSEP